MKTLHQLRQQAHERKHGRPVHKYFESELKVNKPKTAAQLESLISEYCSLSYAECTKIYSGGRQIVKKHKASNILGHERNIVENTFIPGTTRSGTSDLIVIKNNKALYVEVKFSASDHQQKSQKEFQKRVEGFGNTYKVVHDLEEFIEVFNEFFVSL